MPAVDESEQFISATLTTHLLYDDDVDISIDSNDDGIVDKFGPGSSSRKCWPSVSP